MTPPQFSNIFSIQGKDFPDWQAVMRHYIGNKHGILHQWTQEAIPPDKLSSCQAVIAVDQMKQIMTQQPVQGEREEALTQEQREEALTQEQRKEALTQEQRKEATDIGAEKDSLVQQEGGTRGEPGSGVRGP